MNRKLFPLIVGIFVLASCGGPDPRKFNDAIVDMHDEVAQIQSDFDSKLQDAIETDSYGNLNIAADSALAKVDANIEKLKDIKVPKGGEKMVETTMALFQSVKNTINGGLKFTTLQPDHETGEISDEALDSTIGEYNELSEKASSAEKVMIKTQDIFAKEKGFELSK